MIIRSLRKQTPYNFNIQVNMQVENDIFIFLWFGTKKKNITFAGF